jgi:hypothetical protein
MLMIGTLTGECRQSPYTISPPRYLSRALLVIGMSVHRATAGGGPYTATGGQRPNLWLLASNF